MRKFTNFFINIMLYSISIIFLVYGIGIYSQSMINFLFSMGLCVSFCPGIWRLLGRPLARKMLARVGLPLLLFFATVFTIPSNAPPSEILPVNGSQAGEEPGDSVPLKSGADLESLDQLTVYFMDVGQGDATLITCGESSMLIDGGDNSKGTAVQLFLQKHGVTKLDYVIGTHPDADHIGGLDVVVTKFDCGFILLPDAESDTDTYEELMAAMDYRGYQSTSPVVGKRYQLGDAEFEIIAPSQRSGKSTNDWSIGLILSHGEKRFLFTGDAEKGAEADLLDTVENLSCDVYKAGHHGSATSSSSILLDRIKPQYAVISCGAENSYGHPAGETLIGFKDRGIRVFRTDEQGTITAKSDGKNISWDRNPSLSWNAGGAIKAEDGAGVTHEEPGPEAGPVPNSEKKAYVLNTSTKKFHDPSCSRLPGKNRKDVEMKREAVIADGYTPCKICNP